VTRHVSIWFATTVQLMILSEQRPVLTLRGVLKDCDALREERASDYLGSGFGKS
jgi:hypothetical protein